MSATLIPIVAWLASQAAEPGLEELEARVEELALEPLTPRARGELSLVLLEAPERALPLSLRLEAEGVRLIEDRLDWRSVADSLAPLPRLRAPFEAPSEPGRYEIYGRVEYWVCGPRWCRSKSRALSWTIEVV